MVSKIPLKVFTLEFEQIENELASYLFTLRGKLYLVYKW